MIVGAGIQMFLKMTLLVRKVKDGDKNGDREQGREC